jgi:hypothetical protein
MRIPWKDWTARINTDGLPEWIPARGIDQQQRPQDQRPLYWSPGCEVTAILARGVKTAGWPTSRAPAVANSSVPGRLLDPRLDPQTVLRTSVPSIVLRASVPSIVLRASVPSIGRPDRQAFGHPAPTRWLVWGWRWVATARSAPRFPSLSHRRQPPHRLPYARLRPQLGPGARSVAAAGQLLMVLTSQSLAYALRFGAPDPMGPARLRGASGAGRPAAAGA